MTQPFRLSAERAPGLIDRSRTLAFTFNGRAMTGHPGDTLASALLANGVHLVGRSFKYHRPRGILGSGAEDPNGLVQIGGGERSIPNLRATQLMLEDGMMAKSVNAWPSVSFDIGAAFGWGSRFFAAGFYYKTFFGSPWLWHHVFEPFIRRAGGWGTAPTGPDPDRYDHRHAHCEVLVVGGGPAGLAAAREAARSGERVILADEQSGFGGSLLASGEVVDGQPGTEWAAAQRQALADQPHVRLLSRTTVFGYYDGNYLGAIQSLPDGPVRERLWHIRARRVVLATGAHERPLVFADNDRPGVMLAGAVEAYIRRWGVAPGKRLAVFANNDRAYDSAVAAHDAGLSVAAVIDTRSSVSERLAQALATRGIEHLVGHAVVATSGRKRLTGIAVARHAGGQPATSGPAHRIACDVLAVSGGFSPAVHLHCHAQGKLVYDPQIAAFRPDTPPKVTGLHNRSVGGANGTFDLGQAIEEGRAAGALAEAPERGPDPLNIEPAWLIPSTKPVGQGRGKHFVDWQNDTTAADIHLAVREGFESVEHVKRYTLTGFGTDQGKTANINAIGILADRLGRPIPEVGTTTFRPPYTAVTFAAMGGRDRVELFDPARETAMHDWHVARGALFEDVGQWKRPWYYPQGGEDMRAAVARECRAIRESVGVLDASTLGKIDIQGPDAAEFLNRVYTNGWKTLAIGKVRYGLMCGEDGMVFDDGTTARIGEQHYFMTTTSSGAARVLDHLEEYLQTEWPGLRVRLTSVTEQWSNVSIAGPKSLDVLAALAPTLDLASEAFPLLTWRDARVAGLPARIFRVSFTGERQYEINVPWHCGQALWDAVMEAGQPYGITPYGTETMHVLRAEKGFIIAGQETDGCQTPVDLGMGKMVSSKKDFIGRRSLTRSDTAREDRKQLVGLLPENGDLVLPEGTQLVERGTASAPPPVPMLGFVTSSYWSATLGRSIALALVANGRARHDEAIEAALADGGHPVTVCDPVFYDPEGHRHDAA